MLFWAYHFRHDGEPQRDHHEREDQVEKLGAGALGALAERLGKVAIAREAQGRILLVTAVR